MTNYTTELAAFASKFPADKIPSNLTNLFPVYILDVTAAMLAGCVRPVYQYAVSAMSKFFGHGSYN